MFCCCKGKYMGRVPKTMNLEGYCPAVEIRTGVEKMDTHWPRKGKSSDESDLRSCDWVRSVELVNDRQCVDWQAADWIQRRLPRRPTLTAFHTCRLCTRRELELPDARHLTPVARRPRLIIACRSLRGLGKTNRNIPHRHRNVYKWKSTL